MLKVIKTQNYTVPYFRNKRTLPYGNLVITDGKQTKMCPIKDTSDGLQYIVFNRKRYEVCNSGSLYSPQFAIKN